MYRHISRALDGLRRMGAAFAEFHRQQRRMTIKLMSYDLQLTHPDDPPETYGEFLLRTRGLLQCEPSARARLAGRHVR